MSDEAGPLFLYYRMAGSAASSRYARWNCLHKSVLHQFVRWENGLPKTVIDIVMWLGFDRISSNHECVASLKCKICIRYPHRVIFCRNYKTAFTEGSSNLRISMRARAMKLFNRNQGKAVTEYAPIAKALRFLFAVMEQRLKKSLTLRILHVSDTCMLALSK